MMTMGSSHYQLLLAQHAACQTIIIEPESAETDIDPAFLQRDRLLDRDELGQNDLNIQCAQPELVGSVQARCRREWRQQSRCKTAASCRSDPLRHRPEFVGLPQHLNRLLE
jgi:hypothetical protein